MIRSINRCFNPQLLNLCQRAVQLDELNCKIKDNLPIPLSDNCQVGAFERGCLLITTSNATWATELRYSLPDLRDKLRKAGLYQLSSIKIAIVGEEYQKPLPKLANKTSLSPAARDSIRMAGKLCAYQPLKDALNHLADSMDAI